MGSDFGAITNMLLVRLKGRYEVGMICEANKTKSSMGGVEVHSASASLQATISLRPHIPGKESCR